MNQENSDVARAGERLVHLPNISQIRQLRDRGALFVISHSGGKDSQAMAAVIRQAVPASQLLVIHAHLPGAEWDGVKEHIEATTPDGVEVLYCEAVKTFEQMVLSRGMFPSPKYRQCTSDLKRGPIKKAIRHWIKRTGHSGLVVECIGLRAQESTSRAKTCAQPLKFDAGNSKAGREWYTWLPIAQFSTEQVFETIAGAGEQPHWAYGAGMSRLSCCFCIMASADDLRVSAQRNPDLYARYVALELHVNHTMSMSRKGLEWTTGVAADNTAVKRHLAMFRGTAPEGTARLRLAPCLGPAAPDRWSGPEGGYYERQI